jgi:pimeloyl-ACP methyl ester carboxylesterase
MEIKKTSRYKNPELDRQTFNDWVADVENLNQKSYQRINVSTSLGNTCVYGINTDGKDLENIVIFPGARTSVLFWDFDNNLQPLYENHKIYLIETNGLPNNSDGNTPDIHGLDYGKWAAEILGQLNITKAYIAGASFGGLICMKLCITNPELVKAVFLLNPGCLQPFSMAFKNLYYNLLPILFPSRKNISRFLDKAVFSKPNHSPSTMAEKLLIDYELFALTRYIDNTQKPYDMGQQLRQVKSPVYLLEGDKDLLFPYQKSVANAKEKLTELKGIVVLQNVGHGIETHPEAIHTLARWIKNIHTTV